MMPAVMVAGLVLGLFAMVAMTQQAVRTIENPVVEVIAFGESGDGVGLFNTSTGAIQVFTGDPSTSGTHGDWDHEVKGVATYQPGALRLQHPSRGPGLFLVNVRTGDTWVLREPRRHSWYWAPIRAAN